MELHPYLFCLFFCLLYFSCLLSKTMGCFSGCLMSSAGIPNLFCGIYSAFKCSFDEFVGEKVVFPSYSSTILGPPLHNVFFSLPIMLPSVLPRLTTYLAVRVFPGVWKPLFLRLPSRDRAPSLPLLSLFLSFIFFLPPFADNGLLFWVPDVFCRHSEVVLRNLLSV